MRDQGLVDAGGAARPAASPPAAERRPGWRRAFVVAALALALGWLALEIAGPASLGESGPLRWLRLAGQHPIRSALAALLLARGATGARVADRAGEPAGEPGPRDLDPAL